MQTDNPKPFAMYKFIISSIISFKLFKFAAAMELQQVILVDENDVPKGAMGKMEAHLKGELHRAFSIFVFNDKGELLLQKRALNKYHSGGLWTNTCCSHPEPNENLIAAAYKRLHNEMGFECALKNVFHFTYKTKLDNDLTEHEFDHVFTGTYNHAPAINILEVMDWKYMAVDELQKDLKLNPQNYTSWFKIILDTVLKQV